MESHLMISKEDCLKILNKLINNEPFQFINYKVLPIGTGTETFGFLGEHLRLQITVHTKTKRNVTSKFFMKIVPTVLDVHTNYVISSRIFEKELKLYKKLIPQLQSYSDRKWSPVCYFTNAEQPCIVLEDLILKGFRNVPDRSLDLEHCKCVTETLARFHSSSIIMEEKNSYRIFDHFSDMLYETTFSFEEGQPRNYWLKTTIKSIVCLCEKLNRKEIGTEIERFVSKMKDYIKPSEKYRNVLNHGDLWTNNMMFTYNSITNKPEHCILVDYQFARYTPPVYDFLTFLYLTTSDEFHRTHFHDLVEIYYSVFSNELSRHNLDVNQIFCKDLFLECCDFYKPAALLESTMFATIVYLNADYSKDILSDKDLFEDFMLKDRSKLVLKLFEEDLMFNQKLTNLITQLINSIV